MSLLSKAICFSSLMIISPAMADPVLRGSKGDYIVTEYIGSTAQRVWLILTNFEDQPKWAPDIRQSKVLKRNGSTLELQQTYSAGYTFGLPIKARLSVQKSPPNSFSYRLVDGDRLNKLQGSWTITTTAGGVKLRHQIHVDPQVPGPLKSFYYEQQEKNLKQWMTILKRLVEVD